MTQSSHKGAHVHLSLDVRQFYDLSTHLPCHGCVYHRGGKNTHAHGHPWVKSVTGTGRVAKRVSTCIRNGYFTTHYYMDMDTDLIVPIPDYLIFLSYYLKVVILLKEILPPT